MRLTDYRVRKLRQRMREESLILEAVSVRLVELHRSIPAPTLEELHAMESGEATFSLEAIWISRISEQAYYVSEASTKLFSAASERRVLSRPVRYPIRPYAHRVAMLRSGLRGRTLPENFRPEFAHLDPIILLKGQSYISARASGLVTDLLVKGYRWGG